MSMFQVPGKYSYPKGGQAETPDFAAAQSTARVFVLDVGLA